MLKNVCDRCGKPLTGDAVEHKEFDDLDVIERGEVFVSFGDLCDECASELHAAIEAFATNGRNSAANVTPHTEVEQSSPEVRQRKQYPDVEPFDDEPDDEPKARERPDDSGKHARKLDGDGMVTVIRRPTERKFIPDSTASSLFE